MTDADTIGNCPLCVWFSHLDRTHGQVWIYCDRASCQFQPVRQGVFVQFSKSEQAARKDFAEGLAEEVTFYAATNLL